MDVQFQQRLQLKGTVELVEVSQLSSYKPSKPFLLFGHGSKPQFQSIPGYIGSGIPETKDFFENFG